jgi:hypothetical protein
MTREELDKELDKPAYNTMIIIASYLIFGNYGITIMFLFFAIGYIYQYWKNRNWLYREKMINFYLFSLPIYTLFPLMWFYQ